MPAGLEAEGQFAVGLPGGADVRYSRGAGAVRTHLDADVIAGKIRLVPMDPDGDVIVAMGAEGVIQQFAVLDDDEVGRGAGGRDLGPLTIAGHVGAVIEHAFEIDAREAGGAAHGHQARDVRAHPVVELPAQLVVS